MSLFRSVVAAVVAIALCIAFSPTASADTLSISQGDTFIVTDTSSPFSINWQQFNPAAEQSTDVLLSVNISDTLTNNDPEVGILPTNPRDRVQFIFSGIEAPSTTASPEKLLATVTPSMPMTVELEAIAMEALTTPEAMVAFSGLSPFSLPSQAVGSGTVASIVKQSSKPTRTTAGNDGSKDRSKKSSLRAATLTHVHPAPEPPAIMLAGLGVVGVVVADRSRRLLRARAKASDNGLAADTSTTAGIETLSESEQA